MRIHILILFLTIGLCAFALSGSPPETSAASSPIAPVPAATPVAASFSTAVPANRQSAILLLGSDSDSTPLTYAIGSSPSHGALSNLDTSTGVVIYTPPANYTGVDSFGYTVTSDGDTSVAGVVTVTVTTAKTRIIDTLVDPGGNARRGKVTFILTSLVTTPSGVAPSGSSISASLNAQGAFDISVFPSRSMSPESYYQVWLNDPTNLSRNELLGIYDIPASTSSVALSPYRVTDTNLAARYTFASSASVTALTNAVAAATLRSLLGASPTNNVLQKYDSTCDCFKDSNVSSSGTTTTVTGNETVTGNKTTTGNESVGGNSTVTGSQTVGAGTTVTGNANISGNATVGGSLTAAALNGNGAGITGLTGATGGVSNTGSTTIAADSDANGVGKVSLQTATVERLGIESNGTIELGGTVIISGCAGSDDSALISAAVATAAGGWLIIPNGQTCAASDISIPNLRVDKGGLLKTVSSHTVTLSGQFAAGPYQAFTNALSGQGTIALTGSVKEVYPEWWGAVSGASSTTQMSAMQRAVDTGRRVLLTGTYTLNNASAPLLMNNANGIAVLDGGIWNLASITFTSSANAGIKIDFAAVGFPSAEIRNLALNGPTGTTAGNHGIFVPGGTGKVISHLVIDNVVLNHFGAVGILIQGPTGPVQIRDAFVYGNPGDYGMKIGPDANNQCPQDVTIDGGGIQGTSGAPTAGGLSVDGGASGTVSGMTVRDIDIELNDANTKPALYLNHTYGGTYTGLTLSSAASSLSVGDANCYLDSAASGNTFDGLFNYASGGLHNIHDFGSNAGNTFRGGFYVNKASPPSGLGYKAKVTSALRDSFRNLFSSSSTYAADHDGVLENASGANDSEIVGEKKFHASTTYRQPILLFSYETTWQPNSGVSIANGASVHTTITISGVTTAEFVTVMFRSTAGGITDCYLAAYTTGSDTVQVSLLNASGAGKIFSDDVPLLINVYKMSP